MTTAETPQQQRTQIAADISEQSNTLPWQSYTFGDHLREERDDDPAREWDEFTSPMTRHPVLPPVQPYVELADCHHTGTCDCWERYPEVRRGH